MRITKFLSVILVLSVLVGCGGDRDRDIEVNVYVGEQATEGAAVQPTRTPESTVAPTIEPAATQPPATDVPSAATPAEETVPPPTTEPTAEPPTAEPPPPTEAPQLSDDVYTFDPTTWESSVTTLSSFRQKIALDFTADGTGVQSQVGYLAEATMEPLAFHATLTVAGEAASQLPANSVEVIWIGEQAWVKVGRRPWVPVPVTALESEYAGQVVGVGELLPYIPQARRVMPDETINGIPCRHYVYDIDDLPASSSMTAAQGDIWVAKDGEYVVRLTMHGQGTYYDVYTVSGTLDLVYDLYDVNAPISINPPR